MLFYLLVAVALVAEADAPIVESVTISEGECYVMESRDGQVVSTRIPDFHVIEQTGRSERFAPNIPAGASILCPRSSIIPAPNDWKVLQAGYPLYIMETHVPPDERRVGALEVSQGQFRYRLVRGQFGESETERVTERLNQLQESARQSR